MVRSCSAPGCRSGRTLEKPKPSFFLFPLNHSRRRTWADAFPKTNYIPSKNSVLCEKHFRDEDFETMRKDSKESRRKQRGPLKNKKLKAGAVPSIWEDPTSSSSLKSSPHLFMNLIELGHSFPEGKNPALKGGVHLFPAIEKAGKAPTKLIFPSAPRPPRKILPKPISSSQSSLLHVVPKTNVEGDHCYTVGHGIGSGGGVGGDDDHAYAFHNIKREKWEEGDDIVSMYDFDYKIQKAPLPGGVKLYKRDSRYSFYLPTFSEDGNAKMGFTLELLESFKYNAFVNGIKVLREDIKLSFPAKITKISELLSLLEFLKDRSEGTPNSSFLICQAKKSLEACIQISEDSALISKLLFLKEQCDLLLSKSHKYSDSLLSVALLWHQGAPTLYEQIRKDGVMTLPSASHLRRFTAFNAETGLPAAMVSYLRSRFEELNPMERVVAIVFDEVYVTRKFEFNRGRLVEKSVENSLPPKTSFSLLIKSIGGPYRDIVYTSSKSSIKAQTIYDVYMASLKALTEIGFRVVAIYADGSPSTIHFFKDKIFNGTILPTLENPFDSSHRIHIVFEQSTILRNLYLIFLSKKILYCPSFDNFGKFLSPNFEDLKMLYQLEDNKSVKISHYLEDRCLSPSPVEKANFRLGCAVFHESTIKSLECYSDPPAHDFLDTIAFCSIVLKWWDLGNLKSLYSLLLSKNAEGEREALLFLESFTLWLNAWKNSPSLSSNLSPEIYESLSNNADSIPKLASTLLELGASEGIVFQGLQVDSIEDDGHFSQYSGRNFNASVGQLLALEQKIRLSSLIKFSHVTLEPPESPEPAENLSGMDECLISKILSRGDQFVSQSVSGDPCLNFYIAGCILRMMSGHLTCSSCLENAQALTNLPISVIRDDCEMENKEAFIAQISSSVLQAPSDLFFYTVLLANSLYQCIAADEGLSNELRVSPHRETVFSQTFVRSYFDSSVYGLQEVKCAKGHSFRTIAEKVGLHLFSIGARGQFEELFNLIYCQIVRNGFDEEEAMEEERGDEEEEEEEETEVEEETYIVETIEEVDEVQ